MREKMLTESALLDFDRDGLDIEWPTTLEAEMSEYDAYLLLLDNTAANDYFSSYCSIQRPEYHKVH